MIFRPGLSFKFFSKRFWELMDAKIKVDGGEISFPQDGKVVRVFKNVAVSSYCDFLYDFLYDLRRSVLIYDRSGNFVMRLDILSILLMPFQFHGRNLFLITSFKEDEATTG